MSDEGLQVFADEADDLLASAEQALLSLSDLQSESDTLDGINDLFRTFHTIKGAAGLFGLDAIVNFTHIVESLLAKLREKTLTIDEEMVSLFLLSRDHLERLVINALKGETSLTGELIETDNELTTALNVYLETESLPENAEDRNLLPRLDDGKAVSNKNWHISLRFGPDALRNGMEPSSFISYLKNVGEIVSVVLVSDGIPQWSDFEPENCYLGFEISLYALDIDKAKIEEVFEFVLDDCKIGILPPNSHIDDYIKMIEDLPEEDMRLGDILVACGALTESEKENALTIQDNLSDNITVSGSEQSIPPIGQIAVDEQVVAQEVVNAAIKKQAVQKQKRVDYQQSIRVNSHKLESLVDLVGELVIGSANSELHARRLADPNLSEAMENLLRLVEEVRDTTLGLRMVQIGETFNRYKRVVREVSRDTGKDIELIISGAETELDKTLIEKIGDPLMHLVRNSVDHGIESPDVRIAAGKSAKGTVHLDAFHDSGSIVIQIRDDGGGLNKDKILEKALQKNLILEQQSLTDKEIFNLIFEVGFSTADKVSNLSGRGVGMDVVKRNIESLRGQVDIESEQGKGTTISIRLPLTLAIIDGFQVRVDDTQYIVPLDMVDECIELTDALRGKDAEANYVNLRGEILPFMHLNQVFGRRSRYKSDEEIIQQQIVDDATDEKHRDDIVVVEFAGKKAGFVVDELLGEHQTVIKPLGKVFQNLKGISGATILGSGEVAMIIDIPEMIKRVEDLGNEQSMIEQTLH